VPILHCSTACPSSLPISRAELVAANARPRPGLPIALPKSHDGKTQQTKRQKRRSTTADERSSTALSPPKVSRAGLCAAQVAANDTTASALIQATGESLNPNHARVISRESVSLKNGHE
jgi:hypothetical protein